MNDLNGDASVRWQVTRLIDWACMIHGFSDLNTDDQACLIHSGKQTISIHLFVSYLISFS